jgi:hypothetical protein
MMIGSYSIIRVEPVIFQLVDSLYYLQTWKEHLTQEHLPDSACQNYFGQ